MSTVERLRDDIDSGRGGDKVNFPDPAAAPLGADDEAAGTPPSRAEVRQAIAHESGRPIAHKPAWRLDKVDAALVAIVTAMMCAAGAGLAIITSPPPT